jgi:hypothetical protein
MQRESASWVFKTRLQQKGPLARLAVNVLVRADIWPPRRPVGPYLRTARGGFIRLQGDLLSGHYQFGRY